MWNPHKPMDLDGSVTPKNDPHSNVGVPPVWYDPAYVWLADDSDLVLIDDSGNALHVEIEFIADSSYNVLIDDLGEYLTSMEA